MHLSDKSTRIHQILLPHVIIEKCWMISVSIVHIDSICYHTTYFNHDFESGTENDNRNKSKS